MHFKRIQCMVYSYARILTKKKIISTKSILEMRYSLSFKCTDFIITPLAVYDSGTRRSLNSKTRIW